MRSSSPCDILCGSQMMPPLAPPKGMFTTAHFHLLQLATARAAQDLPQSFIKIQLMGGEVKAGGLRLPRIRFLFEVDGFHESLRMIAVGIARQVAREASQSILPLRRLGKRRRTKKGMPYLQCAHACV